jgi:hypothetical protein
LKTVVSVFKILSERRLPFQNGETKPQREFLSTTTTFLEESNFADKMALFWAVTSTDLEMQGVVFLRTFQQQFRKSL